MQHTALTKDVLEVLENLELQAPSGREPSWMYQEGSFSLYMSDSGEVLSLFVSLLSLSLFLCYVFFNQFMIYVLCIIYLYFTFEMNTDDTLRSRLLKHSLVKQDLTFQFARATPG